MFGDKVCPPHGDEVVDTLGDTCTQRPGSLQDRCPLFSLSPLACTSWGKLPLSPSLSITEKVPPAQ